ncbi:MAG TPA: trypsin-like peptidase domain-containing protein [Bryobacteraceae bacterium]|nr:trypsin-like peptidase domain-containing protein [Bryobacteraceae bacterium]
MRAHPIVILGATLIAPAFPQTLRELSTSFESLAARVRPAVVQIFSTGYVQPTETESTSASSLLSTQRSTGSGVILSADGYIVTNNHVVQGARKIEVRLAAMNREEARQPTLIAKLVGVDREADLAVLKVDRADLSHLELGDSDALKQGQLVMAFGNPLGLEGSASTGIISSVSRRLHPEDAKVYIQTDAPINPGNSGGPMIDIEGRVVGINTFILTQSGGSEGLGFAIPSNAVRTAYEQIRKDGHVHRGQIGLVVQSITPAMAKGLRLSQDWGVIASDVTPDGPADKAGLKVRDLIVSLNGRTMQDAPQLETAIYQMRLDDKVQLGVLRDSTKLEYTVPVTEREDDQNRFMDFVNPDDNLVPKLGILGIEISQKLSEMLPELRHEYGIVVAFRSPNAPFTGGPLEQGDVIYEVNRTPVITVKALRSTLESLKSGDTAVVQIQRSQKLLYLTLEFE